MPPSYLSRRLSRRSILSGRHIVVTGAASGIGKAVAQRLALVHGATLSVLDISEGTLTAFAEQIGPSSDNEISPYVVDVTSDASVRGWLEKTRGRPVDGLINCAGVLNLGRFADALPADFDKVFDVNFLGAVRMTRLLLPRLQTASSGFVVNVASVAGLVPTPGMTAYTASKFALIGFSQALRLELGRQVNVLVACPGFVRTGLFTKAGIPRGEGQEQARDRLNQLIGRFGASPDKVAHKIIDGIERKRGMLLVGPDAHLLHLGQRLFPSFTGTLMRWAYESLAKRGGIPS